MTQRIQVGSLARIVAPAHPLSVGHVVRILRCAVGDRDRDGVDFAPRIGEGPTVWVVRGAQVPWGSSNVNVFAIGQECLQLLTNDHRKGLAKQQPCVHAVAS